MCVYIVPRRKEVTYDLREATVAAVFDFFLQISISLNYCVPVLRSGATDGCEMYPAKCPCSGQSSHLELVETAV